MRVGDESVKNYFFAVLDLLFVLLFLFGISYSKEYSLGIVPRLVSVNDIDFTLPRSRVRRVIHYAIHDREQLRKKWKKWQQKKDNPELLPKSKVKRAIYYIIFDQNRIKRKIFKSEK